MIPRIGDGPDASPQGARTVRISAWGQYVGTLWQLGDRVGMMWDRRPIWTDHKYPTPQRSEWTFPTGTATAYFNRFAQN